VEPCPNAAPLLVTLFDVPYSLDAVTAFIAREHEFRFLAAAPTEADGCTPTSRLAVRHGMSCHGMAWHRAAWMWQAAVLVTLHYACMHACCKQCDIAYSSMNATNAPIKRSPLSFISTHITTTCTHTPSSLHRLCAQPTQMSTTALRAARQMSGTGAGACMACRVCGAALCCPAACTFDTAYWRLVALVRWRMQTS
jgi:hypothetical protein